MNTALMFPSSAIEGIYASLEGMSLADSDENTDEANRAARRSEAINQH